MAVHQPRSFTQSQQAIVTGRDLCGVKADSVIFYLKGHHRVLDTCPYPDLAGLGVARDIGQSLASEAQKVFVILAWQLHLQTTGAGNAGRQREMLRFSLNGSENITGRC
jgi:hypothetical protein